ncbi:MFS transporter [Microbispora sp. NPDC049633]|uniref:MFS transporter n=1 Tax=Microbispora sp. NPDC049633 TaxID=3154355 RepID=UPI0034369A03
MASPSLPRFPLFALAATALCASFSLADTALVTATWRTSPPVVITLGGIVEQAGIVLLALPLGVLIDRARRRSVMVLSALLGAVAVTSVATAGTLGSAAWPHLLTVTMATGVLASVAAVGQDAYLPSVVRRGRLLPANALLTVLPQIAVVPVMLTVLDWPGLTFAFTVGLGLAVAAALFRGVAAAERPPPPRSGLWREAAEGIRFTARHPALRAIALCLLLSSLLAELRGEVRDEAWATTFQDVSGANGRFAWWLMAYSPYAPYVLGALLAVLLHRRLGAFRLAFWALLVSGPFTLLLALSAPGPGSIWYVLGATAPATGRVIAAVALLSHRQAVTPNRLLGRTGGLLLLLTTVADEAGKFLEWPAERLAELGGVTPPAIATAAALAAAVPLLWARRSAADHDAEPAEESGPADGQATDWPPSAIVGAVRRAGPPLAVLALLATLPPADLAYGRVTTADQCAPRYGDAARVPTGERAFICGVRRSGRFTAVSDRDLLAYGRAMCEVYPGPHADEGLIAPICPPAAAKIQAEIDAEEAEYRAREAAGQKVCDRSRHRPLIRPVRVARERTWTDYGVLESFEYDDSMPSDPFDDGLLDTAQDDDLVAAVPGHLMILSHSDYDICVTTETYRTRPPVEVKGWHRVVEIGYRSPTGHIELRDPMGGEPLPNLAFRGKGRYRIRVHYRQPDWEAGTPQHLLIMVFSGRSDRVVEHRRSR